LLLGRQPGSTQLSASRRGSLRVAMHFRKLEKTAENSQVLLKTRNGCGKILHNAVSESVLNERCCEMGVNYKGLWKKLIDDEINRSDLHAVTGIAPSTFSKMRKNQYVSLDVLVRICRALNCQLSDIVEVEFDSKS
jgi:putative transcriptional regulator